MKNKDELKWDKRFMQIANLVASWSTCIREGRKVGAVIAKDHRILTTGYNGSPAGIKNCTERGACIREELNVKSGTCLEMCYSLCAEQNAVVQAAKLGHSVDGATIYVTHRPCPICTRIIINSGIKRIVYQEDYPNAFSLELIKESGIEFERLTKEEVYK